MRPRPTWILAAATLAISCSSGPAVTSPPPARPPPARILVLGDVQLANAFKETPSLTTWREAKLDTRELATFLSEALRDTHPDVIVHTGDLVDLNESAVLEVRDASGRVTSRTKQPLEEWKPVLSVFASAPRLYPTVGNHERYGELVVTAAVLPDGDAVELRDLQLTKRLRPGEVHAQTLARFPHLAGVDFHGKSGSYAATFARFCLISIDGADFDDDPSLFTFVDDRLRRCADQRLQAIVTNHYPLFSGRPAKEDASLELHAHRERLLAIFARRRPALVLSGHEHFYLRYLPEGRGRAGYAVDLPPRPVHLTVSDFANPYSRKLERLDPVKDAAGIRYFRGTHYAYVEIDDAGVGVTVRARDRETSEWRVMDSFRVDT